MSEETPTVLAPLIKPGHTTSEFKGTWIGVIASIIAIILGLLGTKIGLSTDISESLVTNGSLSIPGLLGLYTLGRSWIKRTR